MITAKAILLVVVGSDALDGLIAVRFARVEPRAWVDAYLRGLLVRGGLSLSRGLIVTDREV